MRLLFNALLIALVLSLSAAGCSPTGLSGGPSGSSASPARATRPDVSPEPSPQATQPDWLTAEEAATLASLALVDPYPLYRMEYGRSGQNAASLRPVASLPARGVLDPGWGCSLFAALGDETNRLYGRNFDWRFSPALLLFTDPPRSGGYRSVSLVDLEYLGFGGERAERLLELPLAARRALLKAPLLPFDGMNEAGLAIGMAAVPQADELQDPSRLPLDSLAVIREILDRAATVDEAVVILRSYNIEWGSGPPLHYLLADRGGRAALVEFYDGAVVVLPNSDPWHAATNFTLSAAGSHTEGICPRYDAITQRMGAADGRLDAIRAMELLKEVTQRDTQWSAVYNMSTGQVDIVMGRGFAQVHSHTLTPAR